MTITISERAGEQLRRQAAERGQELETYVETLIAQQSVDPLTGMTFKPMQQFVEEQRAKHGFPADWGTKPVVLSDEEWEEINAALETVDTANHELEA